MVKSAGMLIKGSLLALLVAVVYAEGDAVASDPAPDNRAGETNSDGDKSASYPPRKRYGNQKGGNGSRWRNGRPRQRNGWGGRMKKRQGGRWRRPANWSRPNRPSNWEKPSESESWDSPSIDWEKPVESESWDSPSWDGDTHDTDDKWSADGYKTCDTVSHSCILAFIGSFFLLMHLSHKYTLSCFSQIVTFVVI